MKFAFDVETTGLEGGSRAIEIAGVMFDGAVVLSRFETLINPGMPIPADVTKINGITDAMVRDAPGTHEALSSFFAWAGDTRMAVAQYAQYDTGIISWDAARVGVAIPEGLQVIDTCAIAKALGATKNNKIEALVEHYGIRREGAAHRAMSDADACMKVFVAMVCSIPPAAYGCRDWAQAGHDYAYFDPAFVPEASFLPHFVAEGASLSFSYEDDKGLKSERAVVPYGWALKGANHYFHGWCLLRDARRTFRTDRIIQILSAAA